MGICGWAFSLPVETWELLFRNSVHHGSLNTNAYEKIDDRPFCAGQ